MQPADFESRVAAGVPAAAARVAVLRESAAESAAAVEARRFGPLPAAPPRALLPCQYAVGRSMARSGSGLRTRTCRFNVFR